MTRGVQVVMSTRINSVLDALMSALIAVDIDTAWRFLTKRWVVVMDTTAIQEKNRRDICFFFTSEFTCTGDHPRTGIERIASAHPNTRAPIRTSEGKLARGPSLQKYARVVAPPL